MTKMFVNSKTGAKGRIEEYHFTYKSKSVSGEDITLSGVAVLPNYASDGTFIHTVDALSLSHERWKKRTNYVSLVGSMDYLRTIFNQMVVLSDYEGYGKTIDKIHPLLSYNELAVQSVDCAMAALELLDHINVEIKPGFKTYNMGMSKGAPVAMATQRMVETTSRADVKEKLNIAGTYCCSGPYDLRMAFEQSVNSTELRACWLDVAIVQSAYLAHKDYFSGYEFNDFFNPSFPMQELVGLFDEKNSYSKELNEAFSNAGITCLKDVFREEFFNQDGTFNTDYDLLKKLLEVLDMENPAKGWSPKSPLLIEHSKDDNFAIYDFSIQTYNDLKYHNSASPNPFVHQNTYAGFGDLVIDHDTISMIGMLHFF